jgi:diacylglycerol kinase family enzyme
MSPDIAWLVVVIPVLAVIATLGVAVVRDHRRQVRRPARPVVEPLAAAPEDRPLAAVVVNPTKFNGGTARVRREVEAVCEDLGWASPLWLETTEEDPGLGQTRQAVEKGADVVVACGGDGTVRVVGEALAGGQTALGLLPAGTGNLLARNLDMDLTDIGAAMRVALSGDDRPVDVGWITVDGASGEVHETPEEQAFLVMAGMGFDAAMLAGAPEALKARVGPVAYFVSGIRLLRGKQARVQLRMDDGPPVSRRARTVVIGNCGKLLGGIVLMPDAEVDDGWLDVVSIAPSGIVGWAAVAARVISRRRRGHPRVEHWRCRSLTLATDPPQPAQLDGDPVGDALQLRMRVAPRALLVRVPAA